MAHGFVALRDIEYNFFKRGYLSHCNEALKVPLGGLCQKCANLFRLRVRESDERKSFSVSWVMPCHVDRLLNDAGYP